MSLYATDYNGWAPRTYDGNTKKTWSSTLYDQQYVNSRDIFVCPSAKPENYLSQGYTYGIWSYDYSYQIKLWGNFSHPGNIPYTKDGPSCHIVAADSIAKTGTSSQIYHIYGWVNSERFFDLRHNRKCNAYFADGHAEGVNSERTQAYGIRYYAKEGVLCSNW
jgi:prepilin-type processing-associated H-X9-DG protein